MGLECPVCDRPQADAKHLAHHVAVTAIMGGEAHESFLDEHVTSWEQSSPAELGEAISSHATETDHEPSSVPGDNLDPERGPRGPGRSGDRSGVEDERVAAILEQARAYTDEMYGMDENAEDEAENE